MLVCTGRARPRAQCRHRADSRAAGVDRRDDGTGLAGQLTLIGPLQAGLANHARRACTASPALQLLGRDRADRTDQIAEARRHRCTFADGLEDRAGNGVDRRLQLLIASQAYREDRLEPGRLLFRAGQRCVDGLRRRAGRQQRGPDDGVILDPLALDARPSPSPPESSAAHRPAPRICARGGQTGASERWSPGWRSCGAMVAGDQATSQAARRAGQPQRRLDADSADAGQRDLPRSPARGPCCH